jgi:hypothetical protein
LIRALAQSLTGPGGRRCAPGCSWSMLISSDGRRCSVGTISVTPFSRCR